MGKLIESGLRALILFGAAISCAAATKTWVPTAGGVWTTSGNWSPSGAPQAGDAVTINSNQSGDITGVPSITLSNLVVNGNCLLAAASSGNTITVTNALSVATGKLLTLGATSARLVFRLDGTGTLSGSLAFDAGTTVRNFTVNGTLIIQPGARLYDPNLSAGSVFILSSGATLKIGNTGGISTSTSANSTVAVNFGGSYSYSTGANYEYIGSANQAVGNGLPGTVNHLTVNNSGSTGNNTVTLASALVVNGNLAITAGTLATGNNAITLNGNFSKAGTLSAGSSGITIAGAASSQSIAGFTTTGNLTCSKSSGTATLQGDVSAAALSMNASGATLHLGSGLTHTFSGTWTRTAGTLNGGSSTLKLNNATPISGSGGVFTAGTGRVEFGGATAQSVASLAYANLTISGSGTKTLAGAVTLSGSLEIAAGTLDVANGSNYAISLAGNWTNNGTFTGRSGTVTFNGSSTQHITGTTTTTFYALALTGTHLALASSVIFPVNSFSVAGVGQSSGTWGGSGSGATHINTNFFSADTGKLNVATGLGPVDHFAITTPATQTAGSSFTVTLTAQDANDATVTSFTGTVDLAETGDGAGGTVTPSISSAFVAGVRSGQSVVLTKAGAAVTLKATDHAGTGKTGTSAAFTVNPAAVSHYAVTVVAAPFYIGEIFETIVTAQDAYNNTVVSDSTTWVTNTSNSLNIQWDATDAGEFDNGVNPLERYHVSKPLTNGVTRFSTKTLVAETGITITTTDPDGLTGTSATFDVDTPTGAYRSAASGNWSDSSTWEKFVDAAWTTADAAPDYAAGVITIRAGHQVAVTLSLDVDQVHIQGGAQVNINSGATVSIRNLAAPAPGLEVYGTLHNEGTLTFESGQHSFVWEGGVLENAGTVNSTSLTLEFEPGVFLGGKYRHLFAGSAGTIPTAEWEVLSICEIAGYTVNDSPPGGLGQSFASFIWNCPTQSTAINLGGGIGSVQDLTVRATGSGSLALGGNLDVPGAVLVESGAQLNCDNTILTGGSFGLAPGGTLGIGAADGITSSGLSGNIRTTTRNFDAAASYVFNGSSAQVTGSGFPATVQNLTVANSAGLTYAGTLTVNGNCTIDGGAVFQLSGTLNGSLIVNGMLACAGTSIGGLALDATPDLAGTLSLQVNKTGATNDQITRVGGTLAYGGTLAVTNVNGTLAAGDQFTLFPAGSYSGAFTAFDLPALTTGLNWYTGNLTNNGTILVNQKPAGGSHSFTTRTNLPLVLSMAKLLAGDGDPDGNPLSIAGVAAASPVGSSVSMDAQSIIYTPGSTAGSGSFQYELSDGFGGTDTVTVNLTITSGDTGAVSANVVYGPAIEGAEFVVRFAGRPGAVYTIEYAPESSGPWSKEVNLTAPADNASGFGIGVFEFRDTLRSAGFYRTVYPSY